MSKENNINNSNKNEGNDESLWGLPLSSFAKYTYVYNKDEILSFNTNRKFEPPEALVSTKLYSPEVLIPVNQDATQLDDYEKVILFINFQINLKLDTFSLSLKFKYIIIIFHLYNQNKISLFYSL